MKKNEFVTRFTLYSLRTALKKMSISLDTTMFMCSSCYENFFYKRPTSFAHLASEIFILDKSKKNCTQ